jgi:hypothetical protein
MLSISIPVLWRMRGFSLEVLLSPLRRIPFPIMLLGPSACGLLISILLLLPI